MSDLLVDAIFSMRLSDDFVCLEPVAAGPSPSSNLEKT